jgi:hypothetical protein
MGAKVRKILGMVLIAAGAMTAPAVAANTLELNCTCSKYIHQIPSFDAYANGVMTVSRETLPFDASQCSASSDTVLIDLDASTIASTAGSGAYGFHEYLNSPQPATISSSRISASGQPKGWEWTVKIDRKNGRYKYELRDPTSPKYLVSVDGICVKTEPKP